MPAWTLNVITPPSGVDDFDYRVSPTSVATLLRLRDLGISPPDQAIWFPYAESYIRGDNSRAGDGLPFVEWVWDVMDIQQAYTLMNMFFSTQTTTSTDNVFIRTDVRQGDSASPRNAFKNYECTVWRPEMFGPDGQPIVRSGKALQTVKFKFVNLVEQ